MKLATITAASLALIAGHAFAQQAQPDMNTPVVIHTTLGKAQLMYAAMVGEPLTQKVAAPAEKDVSDGVQEALKPTPKPEVKK